MAKWTVEFPWSASGPGQGPYLDKVKRGKGRPVVRSDDGRGIGVPGKNGADNQRQIAKVIAEALTQHNL